MIHRRHFFLSALTAAAATRVRGANDSVAVGIIGVGGRGRSLLREYAKLPDARITHICDVDQASIERANAMAKQSNVPQPEAAGDLRRLLDNQQIQAVVIATPDHWHAPATLLGCQAGKDVYVEKPASHNIREGRLMVEAARYYNRIVQHGTQARSRPSTMRAVDYVRSGKIGRVLMAKAWNVQLRKNIGHKDDGPVPDGVDYETYLGPAPWIPFNENRFHYNWHWHWHFGTGDIGNDGVHQLDIARWALGASYPRRISGMGRKLFFDDDQQTPDTVNVTFDYGDRALQFEMRIWNPYMMNGVENGVAVYGTEGMVEIGPWGPKWGFRVYDKDGQLTLKDEANEPDNHARNFLDCVRSRKLPNADIGIGHLSTLHAHLANIVARTGRNLTFEQETETFVDDPGANTYVRRSYRKHWAAPANA